MIITIVVSVAAFIFLACIAGIYNSLIGAKNAVKNAWATIDTQLKRRHDLILNLVEATKGYMEHEKSTFELVTKARNNAMSQKGGINEQIAAENQLTGALKTIFALSENYPELKANQNFLSLQEELASTENKISFARIAYNDALMMYKNKKEQFPSNIVASMFNFEEFSFFEADDSEKNAVEVKF